MNDYIIVTAITVDELSKKVKDKMKDNYEAMGGVASKSAADKNETYNYLQAMIKYDGDDINLSFED